MCVWGGGGSETFEHNFMMKRHMYYKSERGSILLADRICLGSCWVGGIPVPPPPTPLLYATLLVMFMFTTVHVG